MASKNVLVRLKDQTTKLRCPATGWEITRSEEKRTPNSHSPRIAGWLASGALVRCEGEEAPSNKYAGLLDTPHKGMNREALVEFAGLVNEDDPEAGIETNE
jgi:hypothetical protein